MLSRGRLKSLNNIDIVKLGYHPFRKIWVIGVVWRWFNGEGCWAHWPTCISVAPVNLCSACIVRVVA